MWASGSTCFTVPTDSSERARQLPHAVQIQVVGRLVEKQQLRYRWGEQDPHEGDTEALTPNTTGRSLAAGPPGATS